MIVIEAFERGRLLEIIIYEGTQLERLRKCENSIVGKLSLDSPYL